MINNTDFVLKKCLPLRDKREIFLYWLKLTARSDGRPRKKEAKRIFDKTLNANKIDRKHYHVANKQALLYGKYKDGHKLRI